MTSAAMSGYSPANLFAANNNGSTAADTEFLKAMNTARRNKPTSNPLRREKHIDTASALDLSLQTADASLFDFHSPSRTDSPFQSQFSSASTGNMPGWASDMTFQPLSPPDSASLDSKGWDYPFPAYPQPSNILSSIQGHHVRAQFGQVTPPDDEEHDEDFYLDRHMPDDESEEPDTKPDPEPTPTASKKRPRNVTTNSSSSTNASIKAAPPSKRSRKSNARSATAVTAAVQPVTHKVEDVKRSKFLERNRVAASKCRQKKKEWTQNLEKRAREMQKHNASMRVLADSLRQEILFLKGEMLKHASCDCVQIQRFMKDHAHNLSHSGGPASDALRRLAADHGADADADDDDLLNLKTESEAASDFHAVNEAALSPATGDEQSGSLAPHSDNEGSDDQVTDDEAAAGRAAEIARDESVLEALLTSSLQGESRDETMTG